MDDLIRAALDCGFTKASQLDISTLKFLTEVREMCASDKCRNYNKSWACPPACGDTEEMAKNVACFKHGLLLQTVGQMEDDFDVEAIMDNEARHKHSFEKFVKKLRPLFPGMLPMSAGACTKCAKCTYPDSPCRFPNEVFPSMEAYGLLVSQVCTDNGMAYNNGPRTIAFTSCILLD